ncbi:MAG TPA: S41 family peptidase [Solirubrobacterales bacterium]|nr:S41 family peptidase [Solirubrobacterales bacterium]
MTRGITAVVAVLAALALGMYLGGHPSDLPQPLRDVFVDENASVQAEATDIIRDNYYRSVGGARLRDASLRGMVRSLNSRFSHYFTPRENALFRQATSGEFSGVGMTVVEHPRGLRVAGVFDDSPAKRAGIRPGDVITRVNGRSIAGQASDVSTARIKGKEGTQVRLTIRRGKRTLQVRTRRERIRVPAVSSAARRARGQKLAVIELAGFTSGAHGELVREIKRRERSGAEGFVLDLRANGGGLLDEAVLVSSAFVPRGVIVTTKGRKRPRRVFKATGEVATRKPVVVLVDRGTASASEIVTAALHERLGAPVVGRRTFGKGVFGQIFDLSNGGALDLVVGNYYTPEGRNLNGKGIRPDIQSEDDPDTTRDEALQRALNTLAGRVERTG